jgi:uncharacterized protein
VQDEPRRPAPVITDDNAFYWEAAGEGKLVAQRCGDCGVLRHPPRPMCGHCQSLDVEIVRLSGRGTLYSYAVLHHPQHPAFDYPVLAALVDLDEGIRLLSELADVDPADIAIGMALTAGFAPTVGGMAVPVFRAAS